MVAVPVTSPVTSPTTLPVTLPTTSPVTLPVREAVIVPAEKLPEPSLATRLLAVLLLVASSPIVTEVPATEVLTKSPSTNVNPSTKRLTLPVPEPPTIESDVLIATLTALVILPLESTVICDTCEPDPYVAAETPVLARVAEIVALAEPSNEAEPVASPEIAKVLAVCRAVAVAAFPEVSCQSGLHQVN